MRVAKLVEYSLVFEHLANSRRIQPHNIKLGDARFNCPDPEWVTIDFGRWLTAQLYGRPYLPEAWDCENISLYAVAMACDAHRQSVMNGQGDMAGILFGELWVPRITHAITWAGHWTDGTFWTRAYEPQVSAPLETINAVSMMPVLLTDEDWASADLAKAQ